MTDGLASQPNDEQTTTESQAVEAETPPREEEVALLQPQPEEQVPPPDEIAVEELPTPKPVQPEAAQPKQSAAATAGGVGLGRSDLSTNYRGRVAAHLARHKRFPRDARGSDEKRVVVSFVIGTAGDVTSVELVKGAGEPSLDREATAMVSRASPFPPPPDGRPAAFTVPIRFKPQ